MRGTNVKILRRALKGVTKAQWRRAKKLFTSSDTEHRTNTLKLMKRGEYDPRSLRP